MPSLGTSGSLEPRRVIAPRPPGVSRGGRTGHRQGTARRDVVAGLDVGGDRHAKSLGETMGEPVRAKRPHMAPSPRPVAVADWGRSQAAPGLPPVILRFGPDPFGERQEQHARLAIGTAPVPRQCRASAVRRRSKTPVAVCTMAQHVQVDRPVRGLDAGVVERHLEGAPGSLASSYPNGNRRG